MGFKQSTFRKPKVIVIGASGHVGQATLSSLVARHSSSVQKFAGVRIASKCKAIKGVSVVKADRNDKAKLALLFTTFDRVSIVTPGHKERTWLTSNELEAENEAGVSFVAVVSVLTSETDTIFGRQFGPIEALTKNIGIPYSILRLPLFVDNSLLSADSIKKQGTFYDPKTLRRSTQPPSYLT